MTAPFRVALSGDFRKPDGSPVYPDFDLTPLKNAPGVEMAFLESANPIRGEQLEDFDAFFSQRGQELLATSGALELRRGESPLDFERRLEQLFNAAYTFGDEERSLFAGFSAFQVPRQREQFQAMDPGLVWNRTCPFRLRWNLPQELP